MDERLPPASMYDHNSLQNIMNQISDIAEKSGQFHVERRFNFEPTLRMDIVDLFPKFPVAHQELFGQLVYIPDYKQKIALEARDLASKLGEDMAQQGEILLTANARAALQDATVQTREDTVSISGLSLAYHVVQS